VNWIRRHILFHGKRHPNEMGSVEVETFLTHLAVKDIIGPPFELNPDGGSNPNWSLVIGHC